jgi:hypothetical protein
MLPMKRLVLYFWNDPWDLGLVHSENYGVHCRIISKHCLAHVETSTFLILKKHSGYQLPHQMSSCKTVCIQLTDMLTDSQSSYTVIYLPFITYWGHAVA